MELNELSEGDFFRVAGECIDVFKLKSDFGVMLQVENVWSGQRSGMLNTISIVLIEKNSTEKTKHPAPKQFGGAMIGEGCTKCGRAISTGGCSVCKTY